MDPKVNHKNLLKELSVLQELCQLNHVNIDKKKNSQVILLEEVPHQKNKKVLKLPPLLLELLLPLLDQEALPPPLVPLLLKKL